MKKPLARGSARNGTGAGAPAGAQHVSGGGRWQFVYFSPISSRDWTAKTFSASSVRRSMELIFSTFF